MKNIYIITGGTVNHIRPHFAVSAPAYGTVGSKLYHNLSALYKNDTEHRIVLVPTQMALGVLPGECGMDYIHLLKQAKLNKLETNKDLSDLIDYLISDKDTRSIIMAAAVCDFEAKEIVDFESDSYFDPQIGKDYERLDSSHSYTVKLKPSDKLLSKIRQMRKNIFVVSFKTTSGKGFDETYKAGLLSLKKNSSNLVFANDIKDHVNMVITPEEFPYKAETRDEALKILAEMVYHRLNLTFDDKTVIKDQDRGFPHVLVTEGAIPENWYQLMNYLFENNAFKPLPMTGKTSGHFGCRVTGRDYERITSERKINHNESFDRGMIRVYSYENNNLIVGGAKPSVGEKTQELIYAQLGDKIDAIVHFHCPLKHGELETTIPIKEQFKYECGSKECALNTVSGIKEIEPGIYAVHLNNHGPNIAFSKDVPVEELIKFINKYWDLTNKTGGIIK